MGRRGVHSVSVHGSPMAPQGGRDVQGGAEVGERTEDVKEDQADGRGRAGDGERRHAAPRTVT